MKISGYCLFISLILSGFLIGQSNDCSTATILSVASSCSPVSGTTTGATQSISGCSGTADDDVWYQFIATASTHQISLTSSATFDGVLQLFSGACSSLVSLNCMDNSGIGGNEIINASGLTVGATYRIRIYHYGTGSGSGSFTICVANAPPPPTNNGCNNAVSLTVNTSCTFTSGTTVGATQSSVGCSGTADDDVWYSFVATNAVQTITVDPLDASDFVVQLYSGICGSLTSIQCQDATFSGQNEVINAVGLTPGQTYRIRIYDYYAGNTGDFQVCVTGTATATPTNNEPCSAIILPTVTANCNYAEFTTVGATASLTAPTPSGCVGGSAPQQGGFSSTSKDVWFAITVPSSGNVFITSKPNMGAGAITDGVMVLYSGSCSSLTQIACSDDHTAYPGTANDLLPLISATGLTPGSTVYLRYFGYGSSSGTFGICVTTATNDNCANALYICDLNGYNASTSAAYTPDRPGNMRGNNEDVAGNNMPDGTNTGGIFGQGGSWGVGAPNFDVTINNNSWIKFTAASSVAVLQVSVYDCWVGNYPSGGLQMQVFEGTNCTNFVPVSDFKESSSGFSITANNLTVGNDYYLMVDGFAGDICNYSITAQSGVQFPDIPDVPPICSGQSVTLTAPSGATSYEWQHDGSTTQSVNVSPGTTQTYYCEVSGLCDYKQMLEVTVQVNENPMLSIVPSSNSVCIGNSATLNVSGANSYLWSTSQSGTSITVSPTTPTTYTVTGTTNGCTNSASILISINNLPSLTVSPSQTPSDCGGSNGSLIGLNASGAGTLTYEWTTGSGSVVGNSADLSSIPAGTYFVQVTDANNCSNQFGPFSITNPGAPGAPSLLVSDNTPCVGSSFQISVNAPTSGATYNWTGPNGFSSTNTFISINPVNLVQEGTYCVNATVSGCTGPASCEIIDVQQLPLVEIPISLTDSTICTGGQISISAAGAVSYLWSGPNGFSGAGNSISISPATAVNGGYYFVTATDMNGCINEDSININILPLPTLVLSTSNSNGIACLNSTISISVSGANSYLWEGPNSFSSMQNQANIPAAEAVNEGWYIVTGTDGNGCSAMDSLFINVISDFSGGIVDGDSILCPGETAVLSAQGGSSYLWSGPLGFSSTNPIATIESISPQQAGWYEILITDTYGCIYVDSTELQIQYNADCIFIPNLFTPDLDGNNDTWVIPGLEYYQSNSVEIYNRWGNLVFKASPYLNDWDGSVNSGIVLDGKDGKVPVGTYFYILKLNTNDQPPYKGYVEVQF